MKKSNATKLTSKIKNRTSCINHYFLELNIDRDMALGWFKNFRQIIKQNEPELRFAHQNYGEPRENF